MDIKSKVKKATERRHRATLKHARASERRRLENRYKIKTVRTFIKRLKNTKDKQEAIELHKIVSSKLDKLAKKNIIHKNKAANNKSKLAKYVNSLE